LGLIPVRFAENYSDFLQVCFAPAKCKIFYINAAVLLLVIVMALKEPNSMDECAYFTRRNTNTMRIIVWVFKQECPKCHAIMGKPKGKNEKVMIRAKEFTCEKCGYTESKDDYESKLTANGKYTCLKCNFEGEGQISFKWKTIDGIPTLRFVCEKCKANIDVTKKMKEKVL